MRPRPCAPRAPVPAHHARLSLCAASFPLAPLVSSTLARCALPGAQFIDSTGTAKIADFGLARILSPAAMVSLTGETGSYLWMAPEVIRQASKGLEWDTCCSRSRASSLQAGLTQLGCLPPAPPPQPACLLCGPCAHIHSAHAAGIPSHPHAFSGSAPPGLAGTRPTTPAPTAGPLACCWWSCSRSRSRTRSCTSRRSRSPSRWGRAWTAQLGRQHTWQRAQASRHAPMSSKATLSRGRTHSLLPSGHGHLPHPLDPCRPAPPAGGG